MSHKVETTMPQFVSAKDLFDLSGKVAFIVGGGGKMGTQFAATLSLAGAKVIIGDNNADNLRRASQEIRRLSGNEIMSCKIDSSDDQSVTQCFSSIATEYGHLDILIYNVMSRPPGYYRSSAEYGLETWNQAMNENLTGAFLCCRQAARLMRQVGSGTIALTASIYGIVAPDQSVYKNCRAESNIYGEDDPLNCPAVYSASKAGLIGLAKHLAARWGKDNIRVNVLTPGGVFDGQEEAFYQEYVKRTPLQRMASWSDFNGAMLFLVSEASRYMTGANLIVDGGWTTW